MAKKISKRHAIFIQKMVEIGETPEGQIKAYRIAYPSCKSDEAARSASSRLLRNVPKISAAIIEGQKQKQQIIQEARKEELARQAKESLLSQVEVDAILCEIIQGKRLNEVKKPMFNPHRGLFEIITVTEKPSGTEIISAIDKYNKRFGAYAAKKLDLVDERDKVLIPGEDES